MGAANSAEVSWFGELQVEPPPAAVRPRRKAKLDVLLVDDDAADCSLILRALRQLPEVRVAWSTDAPEFALRQLAANILKPDLLLLDINMPRVDGFTFLKRLRQLPHLAAVPVVFLTTSQLPADRLDYVKGSASLYVVKPDTYAELQVRISGVVRRARVGIWSE
ncbi:MAG: Two-component system-Response regulator, receiver domain [Caulobacter sp.]|nr:Two-component system-Response regulator, receiver domain [Caulobacter sp.]